MASGKNPSAENGAVPSSSGSGEGAKGKGEAAEIEFYRLNLGSPGFAILDFIGFQMDVAATVARGRFVTGAKSCQPFGVLHGGVTAYIAESIVSAAGGNASMQRVAGVEMNVHHLQAVPEGHEVMVTAFPLRQGKRIVVWEVRFEATKLKKSEIETSNIDPPELFLAAVSRVTLIVGLPLDKESHEQTLRNSWSKL